jgi:hypothetical protein
MEDDPFVWLGFDQDEELARLLKFLTKVESRPQRKRICRAIAELIQSDLIRYGLCGGRVGFGIIREWTALKTWARDVFYPSDPVGCALICRLCNPRFVLLETGDANGQPDLIFLSLLWKGNRQGAP